MKRLLWASIFLLVGCSDASVKNISFDAEVPMIQEVSRYLENDDGITEAIIIATPDEWLVTYQVNARHRWSKKKHEQDVKDSLTKIIDANSVTVSNDFKLFYESKKLMNNEVTPEKVKEKLKELKELKEEQT